MKTALPPSDIGTRAAATLSQAKLDPALLENADLATLRALADQLRALTNVARQLEAMDGATAIAGLPSSSALAEATQHVDLKATLVGIAEARQSMAMQAIRDLR